MHYIRDQQKKQRIHFGCALIIKQRVIKVNHELLEIVKKK